ncbi:MAG TPA: sigma-70 family RNA polymerase sigma factor [bacterium]|jgi:RNA polymerase sigma-70 factor (ECF subfamily)|nr:sigma-70 family RNA polymerase sigma factor [bacterium]
MSNDESASLLVAIARRRDLPSFEGLYDRHHRLVYGVACRILGDGHEAEDILQEVFLRVWQRAETYDPARGSAATWLCVLTRSRCLDRLRQKGRRREQSMEPGQLEVHAPSGRNCADPSRDRLLADALNRLPDEQRAAVETVYFKGLTQAETAKHLRVPLGTIKGRLRLAMDKLARTLGVGRDES